MPIYVVITMAAAVEHQPHETAANHERKNDGEDYSYVAMDAHLHVNGIPGGDRPPEGYAQNGEKGKDKEKTLHGTKPLVQKDITQPRCPGSPPEEGFYSTTRAPGTALLREQSITKSNIAVLRFLQ